MTQTRGLKTRVDSDWLKLTAFVDLGEGVADVPQQIGLE